MGELLSFFFDASVVGGKLGSLAILILISIVTISCFLGGYIIMAIFFGIIDIVLVTAFLFNLAKEKQHD